MFNKSLTNYTNFYYILIKYYVYNILYIILSVLFKILIEGLSLTGSYKYLISMQFYEYCFIFIKFHIIIIIPNFKLLH